jgi:hypothetical protein
MQEILSTLEDIFFGERYRPPLPTFGGSVIKPLLIGGSIIGGTLLFVNSRWWEREKRARKWVQQTKHWSRRWGERVLPAWWESLKEIDKTFLTIAGLNAGVFLMWHLPALQPLMTTWFLVGLRNSYKVLPLILSSISHNNLGHLLMNMISLRSSLSMLEFVGRDQVFAIYLSGEYD